MDPEVSVVIPVYRNAETLAELHRRLSRVLTGAGLSFEILLIDDACPAGSLAVAEALARGDGRVAVVALAANVGQHRAVLAGLAQARGAWTVIMDADLQDPPEAIPRLLQKGQEGFAAVFAGRRGGYESAGRLLTSRLFKRVLHWLCGLPPDAGLFVALNRPLAKHLLQMRGPAPMVVAMIGCSGFPAASIPVTRAIRPVGSSAYNSWGRLRSAWRGIAWVLARKHCPGFPAEPATGSPPIKAFIGDRFG